MYPDWMKQAKTPRVELLPYKRPSELPVPAWFDEGDWQGYVPAELISGIYRCTRCGMCEKALKHKSIECDVPVEKRTGPVAFRPPGGSYSDFVVRTAEAAGMRVVLWSVDPLDWQKGTTAREIVERVLDSVQPGSIVVLHDGGGDRSATIEALPKIIRGIRKKGLEFAVLD